MNKTLLIVDLQNDFISGSLAIPDAPSIIPIINILLRAFPYSIATKDWHPPEHCSFKKWPIHCLQNTKGSRFPKEFDISYISLIVFKGSEVNSDSYSGFIDNDSKNETVLDSFLREKKTEQLYICGLATDYCVKATALDAVKRNFNTFIIQDACRGVSPQTTSEALKEMEDNGVKLTDSKKIIKSVLG